MDGTGKNPFGEDRGVRRPSSLRMPDYGFTLDEVLIRELEAAAAIVALPPERVELLGQNAVLARRFVESVANGRHEAFLAGADWSTLRRALVSRRGVRLMDTAAHVGSRPLSPTEEILLGSDALMADRFRDRGWIVEERKGRDGGRCFTARVGR